MLILSTFNSDYLKSPLEFLLKSITSESVTIKYSNKNLMGDLLNLNPNLEKSNVILLRLFDFLEENSIIDEDKLIKHLNLIRKQITVLKQKTSSPFIVFVCPSPKKFLNEKLKKIEESFIKELKENHIYTLSLADVQKIYGIFEYENSIQDETHIPYILLFFIAIACLLVRALCLLWQKIYKVIAVDCDHTIWTGVAADDGIEGIEFKEHNILLQKYLVEQQKRGKIICLCSKNDEKTVLDVFKHHEAVMPLKLKHLSNNKINWESKSENIKKIALELNIFPDSIRFIDDNPTEIHDVSQIPGIFCITMPQNLEAYKHHWAFDFDEHSIVTETDKNRTEFYKKAEIKAALATKFNDPVEYLRSSELGQSITISKIESKEDIKTIQRVSQLSGKTNQFNMFPESTAKEISEIKAIVNSSEREIFIGKIKDNFSLEDITAVAVCSLGRNSLTIDSFFLSCRVFRRGMEYEMLKHIAQFSQERGLKHINLKFKKSKKNNPVSDFLTILSEVTNKDPISRFLLNESKKWGAWIHDNFKFLFKKLKLSLDISLLALDEEFILTLPTRKLIDLELDFLIRTSLNFSQENFDKYQPNQLIKDSNEISEKNLIELQNMTSSLEHLQDKFFIGNNTIKSISKSDNCINEICIRLLGEKGQSQPLVARGLDSLKATELRYYLYQIYDVNITIQKLLCQKTTVTNLIEYIEEQKRSQKNDYPQAQSKETFFLDENFYNQTFPVSFQQKRIWLAEQQESANNSANYHMIACYKVGENLDISRFKIACQKLIEIYDVFGASFFIQEGSLKQSILSPAHRRLNFQEIELSELSLEEAIVFEMSKPWNMTSKAPLMHIKLFKDANYHIFFHVHHAIFDAISFKNCLDTLSKIYRNRLISDSSKLIDFPPQYIEFIDDQHEKLKDDAYQAAAYSFWQSEFSQIETVTTLPHDQALSTFKPATELAAKRYSFTLSFQDLSALKLLAKSTDTTCFSVVTALFVLLIGSYTYQKNITLVTATNGRGDPRFDKMVGFFVNLLILQFDLEKEEKFVDYLKNVNKKILASQEFQNIPFNKIQEILHVQGVKDILLSPALIYQSYAIPELKLDNEIAELEIPKQPIIFDRRETCRFGHFSLFAQENEVGELILKLEYAEDLLSEFFIHSFANNLVHTIKKVCENPVQKLQEISVVCDEEQKQLSSLGQGPIRNSAEKINLVSQFQQSLRNNPENIALSCGQKRLSYKEVDQQSTNLAHALIEAGVKQGNYVGIFLDANYLFFIAELAILKNGAVFIPLSKENPNERLQLIINDAKINFFIVDDNHKGLFDTNAQKYQLISIKTVNDSTNLDKELPQIDKNSDEFCVLYTSGSTGTPKGVILQEKGILRVVESPNFIEVLPGDRMAQTANQAFDAAQLECWLAWNHGANLVLFNKETILDIGLFRNKLKSENITHMWLTAGLFDAYANYQQDLFKSLKYLMVGGDVVHKKSILNVLSLEKHPNIINGYGPTETSIFALTHTFDKQTINNYNTTLIGSPINETGVEIRTPFASITPLGGIGELCINGNGVGSYLNSPKLNQEKFTEDGGKRSYLTGDLVKYTTKNSEIMFIGRSNDDQVKINGYLVTLEEVRNCLSQYPLIKQIHVSIRNIHGTNQLVAFYTLIDKESIQLTKEKLDDYLSKFLEPYKFPSCYKQVDNFILNANGKVDTKQFKGIELKLNDSSEKIITTSTLYQKELLEIIRDCLVNSDNEKNEFKIREAFQNSFPDDIKFNIFRIVTDSIKKMEIINKFNAKFKLRFIEAYKEKQDEYRKEKLVKYLEKIYFTVNELFMNPTIEKLADLLTKKLNNDTKNEALRILKSGDNNLPSIVFIHPAGGGLSCFDKLIGQVKFDNICYGIEDPLLDSNQLKLLTMQQMAQNYLSILANKIQGPFMLAGYSFGGMLALEMAAQYESRSENSHLLEVFLFDTWVVSCANEGIKIKLKHDVLIYCAEQRKQANVNEDSHEMLTLLERLCEHHQTIGFEFKPKKLISIPVCLFKATNLNDEFARMNMQDKFNFLLKFVDEKLFNIREINATHFDLLKSDLIAKHLTEIVNERNFKKCPNNDDKKINKGDRSMLFSSSSPLNEINNDPKFSRLLKPKVK